MKPLPYRLFHSSYTVTQWFKRRFTTLGIGLLICLVISAMIGIDTKQTMAYQIFAFLLSMLGIAMVWSLRFRDRFTVSRTLPKFGTVGISLQYPITIENRTHKLQIGLQISENFADPRPNRTELTKYLRSYPQKSRFVSLSVVYYRWLKLIKRNQGATTKAISLSTIASRSTAKATVELMPSRRGVIRLAGVIIARPDPLGLFNACKMVSLPQSILILPKRYQIPPFELSGARKAQSGNVSLASSVGDSEEFMSLRDYRPGDPLRRIHWKSWAKIGKPVVKEEQAEFFVRHALILDTFQSVEYSDTLEKAVSVAASFACDWQTQESLLDLMFVGESAYCFTSGRGLGNTEQMLEILASVQACQDKPFESLTSRVMERIALLSGCICVLIAWDEERKKLVRYLEGLKVPTLVLVISETEPEDRSNFSNLYWLELDKVQETLMSIST
ncbi:conserved hypothetical protein [Hyella patelloides LEGE 07179]|uniref:DUF58 domain-containing protein n=1 Tax=Hyella patelloides LEGE 07179 TaxID=945734 RepID=A0A563W5A3_9CYAN|nr:DUF58 domain-containing protein [Hyella patelloides]VEP18820.1 conserved hypothetical protein [Hyella patelloides LEGE 07179]